MHGVCFAAAVVAQRNERESESRLIKAQYAVDVEDDNEDVAESGHGNSERNKGKLHAISGHGAAGATAIATAAYEFRPGLGGYKLGHWLA